MSAIPGKDLDIVAAYGGSFLVPQEDNCITSILRQCGKFETDDIGEVVAYISKLKPAFQTDLFIDIGANIGTHSVSALSEYGFSRAISLEPAERNFRILSANLWLNGLGNQVVCIQAAASDRSESSVLYHNPNNCGDHRLGRSPLPSTNAEQTSCEQVNCVNVGDLLLKSEYSFDPSTSLCWIDTQGHEIPILNSLQRHLRNGLTVVVEFWPFGMEAQGYSLDELMIVLSEPTLQIAKLEGRTINPIKFDEVAMLWKELRAVDDGSPEGASFINLLIHTKADGLDSISADNMRRIIMTASCNDCQPIPKVTGSGEIVSDEDGDYQRMHNGLLVKKGGYYGEWMSELISRLKGHHEPQEEFVFHAIAQRSRTDGLMIELGCFWAYYSLWFLKEFPERTAICLEPDSNHLEIARANAKKNKLSERIQLIHGLSSEVTCEPSAFDTETGELEFCKGYTLDDLFLLSGKKFIEIAHCDAQGAEEHVVDQMIRLGIENKLRFCVISTHAFEITGNPLTHQECLNKLLRSGAHIIAEHDVHESYSGDGLIAASFLEVDKDFNVPISCNRYSTSLFPNPAEHLSGCLKEITRLQAVNKALVSQTPSVDDATRSTLTDDAERKPKLLARLLNWGA